MSDTCAGGSERRVYLAEAGQDYESATYRAVFSSSEKAAKWLESKESELSEVIPEDSVWTSVDEFVVDDRCNVDADSD